MLSPLDWYDRLALQFSQAQARLAYEKVSIARASSFCNGFFSFRIPAFGELWPRDYLLPFPENSGLDRVGELGEFYSQRHNVEANEMLAEFTKDEIGWVQTRISTNQAINRTKSRFLEWSFYLTGIGVVFNVAVLFKHLF